MKKAPAKAGNARKPPEPAGNHAVIEDWAGRQMPDLQPIIRRLDRLITETVKGLHYAIKWEKAYYGLPGLGWIIELVSYDVSVNIVFHGGKDFDNPPPDGTGQSRYVKIRALDDVASPSIRKWIEQAGRTPGWS